jgi:hypothetical protein
MLDIEVTEVIYGVMRDLCVVGITMGHAWDYNAWIILEPHV